MKSLPSPWIVAVLLSGAPWQVTEQKDYEHHVDSPVVVTAPDHPVAHGLADFTIHDEINWGYRVGKDVEPFLTTTHARSGKPSAWARREEASRVVYMQLGHGPESFGDANDRRLIAQRIQRTSRADEESEGWVALFDGETLAGWTQHGGKAKYEARDGQIIGTSAPNTGNSFLCTTREFTNFVLELDFKVDKGLNSGVQVRSQVFDRATEFEWNNRRIRVPARRVHGLQVEIDPSARAWSGGIYEEGARGWLNNLEKNQPAREAFRSEDWNSYRIECRGDAIKTWINGVPAADLVDNRVHSGFIALQVHGVGDKEKPMHVRFRNIRLRDL